MAYVVVEPYGKRNAADIGNETANTLLIISTTIFILTYYASSQSKRSHDRNT